MNAAELIRRCRAEACLAVRAALAIATAERQINKLQAIHNRQEPTGSHARKAN
ncbi:hypothetical protein [Pseudonocardia cypriaca]|uniref:Uncharacterized protein n=1 Tax=Pseudonocardia cypriaca TaxID=882449 RepID=A0A543GDF6_9PSEU|nr:hypothetical protein [Pseudonocardia cypriaca]TQM44112.1 hypothetical protein FB388_1474 [Pseudonocardia cypriaca]